MDSKVALSCTRTAPEKHHFFLLTFTFDVILKKEEEKFHMFWSEISFKMTYMSNFLWLHLSYNQSITGVTTHQCISTFSFGSHFFTFSSQMPTFHHNVTYATYVVTNTLANVTFLSCDLMLIFRGKTTSYRQLQIWMKPRKKSSDILHCALCNQHANTRTTQKKRNKNKEPC